MAVTIEVWEPDGTSKRGELTASAAPPTPNVAGTHWSSDLERSGAAILHVASTSDDLAVNPALLDGRPTLRVLVDGADGPAYRLLAHNRTFDDTFDVITLQAKTIKSAVLQRTLLFGHGGLSGLRPDTRLFGFMDPAYITDASWVAPTSHGTQGGRPFDDDRPEGWSDRQAEFITDDTGAENNEGYFWLLADMTVDEEMDVRFEATADEALHLYVDGTPILNSDEQGEFQWDRTYFKTLKLSAGTYRVAAKVFHADRPSAATNVRWFIFSAMRAGVTGNPAAQREVQEIYNDAGVNEIQEVYNDSTTGTFTFSFGGNTTAAIAYNASAATIETELEALPDITDVTVTGAGNSGDPWIIEFVDPGKQNVAELATDDTNMDGTSTVTTTQQGGQGGTFTLTFAGETSAGMDWNASASTFESTLNALSTITEAGGVDVTGSGDADDPWVITFVEYGNQPLMSADDSNLNGHTTGTVITETVDGSLPDVLLRSNTTDWEILPVGSDEPGMTAGRILQLAVSEEQSRGRLSSVTQSYTAAADSDGAAWTETFEFAVPVGSTLDQLCDRLAELGVHTDLDYDLTLHAWDGRGDDLSATVTLTKADLESGRVDRDEDVVNGLLVRNRDDWEFIEDETAAAADGSLVDFVSLGAQPHSGQVGDALLGDQVDEVDRAHHTWPASRGPAPYVDFNVGDTITAPGWDGSGQPLRCLNIIGNLLREGRIMWTAEFTT